MLTGRGGPVFRSPLTIRTSAVLVVAGVLLACGPAAIPRPPYSPQPTSALVLINHEPPPARVENVPPRPASARAAVWVDGEWSWKRRRWSWSPGRWVSPPLGATYSPWVTVRAPDGKLYFAPAQWRDAKGASLDPPKALAPATVESGAVVDAEGEMERTTVTGEE
jgi:hypothetical protein